MPILLERGFTYLLDFFVSNFEKDFGQRFADQKHLQKIQLKRADQTFEHLTIFSKASSSSLIVTPAEPVFVSSIADSSSESESYKRFAQDKLKLEVNFTYIFAPR